MTTYYKATRPDGTDFYSGKVDYAAALTSGRPVRARGGHASGNYPLRLCGPGVLHAATVPAESLIGADWPCRLFAVEGWPLPLDYSDHPHKRGFASLRVVEELPGWQALGPNGEEVAALIERVRQMTLHQAKAVAAAVDDAADAAADAARHAAWVAVRVAAWYAARHAARHAASDIAGALTVRDLITDEQYQALAGPWLSVMGEGALTA